MLCGLSVLSVPLSVCFVILAAFSTSEFVSKFKNMANTPLNTNQEIPMLGTPCTIPLTGNVGVPLMATLNLPGFTLGLPVWLFSTPTVLNAPDASQVSSLYHGHKNTASPSPVLDSPPPSTSCGEVLILVTSSLKGVKEGRIGRRHISKGAPVQPFQATLDPVTQPL